MSKGKRLFSEKERVEKILELRYLLLVEGVTQVQAAAQMGYTAKTIGQWVKACGLRQELKNKKGKLTARSLKMNNSLPPFVAYLRIHHKNLHRQVLPVLNEFSQPS